MSCSKLWFQSTDASLENYNQKYNQIGIICSKTSDFLRSRKTKSSKRKTRSDKFPLTLHPTGQYCKKIRGKIYYFGSDKKQALQSYPGSPSESLGEVKIRMIKYFHVPLTLKGLHGGKPHRDEGIPICIDILRITIIILDQVPQPLSMKGPHKQQTNNYRIKQSSPHNTPLFCLVRPTGLISVVLKSR